MFGRGLRGTFERIPLEYGRLQEVRLRVGRPVYLGLLQGLFVLFHSVVLSAHLRA